MHHNVLCRRGIVIIVGTSQHKDTVLVFGITVGMVDRCREKRSMIVWFEPINAVHSCGCTVHIEYLETMILVACGEDKLSVVRELHRIGATDVWHKPLHTTVPTAILHHNNLQFSVRVKNRQPSEPNRQGHLLMAVVEVDIGIAAQLGYDACLFLVKTKAGFEYRLFFHILLVNANTIVATQTQTEFLIRNTKPIVCVDLCGVETLFEVFYELVVKSLQEIAFEEAFCRLPIPVAMVYVIVITLVVVAHFVPFDVNVLATVKGHIWRQRGVVVHGQHQCPHILVEDLLRLSMRCETSKREEKEKQKNALKDIRFVSRSIVLALQYRQLPMIPDSKETNNDDTECTQQSTDFQSKAKFQTNNIRQASCNTSKSIDFTSENERHIVHKDISNDTTTRTSHCTHRYSDPVRMLQSKRLLQAYNIEKSKTDGIENEPSIIMVDDVLAKHTDGKNCQCTTNEVTAVCHPERIDAKHNVTNRSTTNGCGHTNNPRTKNIEMLTAGQANTGNGESKGSDELDDNECNRQPERVAQILQYLDKPVEHLFILSGQL